MGKWHTVKQGEWLAKIAAMYWIHDAQTIWNHPENEALKQNREPEALFPNDKLYIPDTEQQVSKTGEKTSFIMKLPPPETLKLKVLDADQEPFSNEPYRLNLGGQAFIGTTTSDGEVIIENIHIVGKHEGTLEFPEEGLSFNVDVGHLNPALKRSSVDPEDYDDGLSGIQMRLANLGFKLGAFDSIQGERTTKAIQDFQRIIMQRKSVEATGQLDDETRDAIIKAYEN